MNILVTGGAGFIGSNLCARLLSMGHLVICLDNLQTGNLKNLEQFKSNRNFIFKKADITNKQFFPKLDFIWHLACPASPPKYQADGYKTLQTSLIGTMNMLELAKTHNCPLLFIIILSKSTFIRSDSKHGKLCNKQSFTLTSDGVIFSPLGDNKE